MYRCHHTSMKHEFRYFKAGVHFQIPFLMYIAHADQIGFLIVPDNEILAFSAFYWL